MDEAPHDVTNRDVPPVSRSEAARGTSVWPQSEPGLARLVATAFCAFLFTNWTANLFDGSVLRRLPQADMFWLALKWALPQAISTFVALGILWSVECCRAVSNDPPYRRAVRATANSFWFVSLPLLLLVVVMSVADRREAVYLTPRNSHLWQAALWVLTVAAASKALQYEAKAPELFTALFACAGYGVLIVLRLTALI